MPPETAAVEAAAGCSLSGGSGGCQGPELTRAIKAAVGDRLVATNRPVHEGEAAALLRRIGFWAPLF